MYGSLWISTPFPKNVWFTSRHKPAGIFIYKLYSYMWYSLSTDFSKSCPACLFSPSPSLPTELKSNTSYIKTMTAPVFIQYNTSSFHQSTCLVSKLEATPIAQFYTRITTPFLTQTLHVPPVTSSLHIIMYMYCLYTVLCVLMYVWLNSWVCH